MSRDTDWTKANRRTVVAAAGTALAGLATGVSSVAAAPDGGATDVGIHTAVQRLIRKGKHERAQHLLESHDVTYDADVAKMPTIDHRESDDGVSTQDQWTKSASEFSHYSWHKSGDIYHSFTSWDLEKEGNFETDGPMDGIGITLNPDLWEIVNYSWDFDDKSSLDKRGIKGIIVEFDDPWQDDQYADTTGWASVDYEKTESGSHNVYGTYVHTWNPLGVPGWASFSLAVGPIGVSVSGEVDTWKKRADNNL